MNITSDLKSNAPPAVSAEKNGGDENIQKSIAIDRPVAEVHAFCRELENLASFAGHLESVTVIDERTSYWIARSSENHLWAFGVEIITDRKNDLFSWRSFDDADLCATGSFQFSPGPGNRGTVVKLALRYSTPVEKSPRAMTKVLEKDVQVMIGEDLSRLKFLLEGGTVLSAAAQFSARKKAASFRIPTSELRLGRE